MQTNNHDFLEKQDVSFFYTGEGVYFLLSIFQLVIMAYFFGTSIQLDYFLIAFLIPNFFIISFEGIVKGGFIPKFIELKTDYDEYTSWRFFWQNILITFLVSVAVLIVFFIFGKLIFGILAMGIKLKSTVTIIKIFSYLMLGVVFANVNTVIKETYFSFSEYRYPVIGKLIHMAFLIICVVAYSDELGIYSLVFGFTVGYIFEFFFLVMPLKDKFIHAKEAFLFYKSNAIKSMFKKTLPFLLTAAFLYIEIITDRFIAGFGRYVGTISALNYAFSLSFKIGTIFIIPTIWIFYPKLVQAAKKKSRDEMKKIIIKTVNILFFIGVPVFLLILFASNEFVRVLFFRGTFSELSLRLTRNALIGYSFNIPLFGINSFLIMAFYAQKELKSLTKILATAIFINFWLDVILFGIFGIFGIAFATSIVQFVLMIKLFKELKLKFGIRIILADIQDFAKIIVISVVTLVLSIILLVATNKIIGESLNDYTFRLGFLILEFGAIYYFLSRIFGVKAPEYLAIDERPGIG